jgi:hypothetical protein
MKDIKTIQDLKKGLRPEIVESLIAQGEAKQQSVKSSITADERKKNEAYNTVLENTLVDDGKSPGTNKRKPGALPDINNRDFVDIHKAELIASGVSIQSNEKIILNMLMTRKINKLLRYALINIKKIIFRKSISGGT